MDHVRRIVDQWHAERPDLDPSPLLVIGRIHRIALTLMPELHRVYESFGLGEGDFDMLATLRRAGGACELTPSELMEQTMVTSGAVSKRLDRLEAAGLVERRIAEGDRRSRIVSLTAEGRALIDRALPEHLANQARLLAGLDASDRQALARLLGRLAESLGV